MLFFTLNYTYTFFLFVNQYTLQYMMKLSRILPFLFLLLNISLINAQSPVSWAFSFEDKGDEVRVKATATMQKNWTIYSQHTEDNGPVPTAFYIDDNKVVFSETSKVKKEFDELFEVNVLKFKDKAEFEYTVKKGKKRAISGVVQFMCCDNEKCLPPTDVPFNYSW